jgi:hypothetical protein
MAKPPNGEPTTNYSRLLNGKGIGYGNLLRKTKGKNPGLFERILIGTWCLFPEWGERLEVEHQRVLKDHTFSVPV